MKNSVTKDICASLTGFKIQKVKIVDQRPYLVVFEVYRKLGAADPENICVFWHVKAKEMAFTKKGEIAVQSFPNPSQSLIALRKIFENHWIQGVYFHDKEIYFDLKGKEEKKVKLEFGNILKFVEVKNLQLPEMVKVEPVPFEFNVEKVKSWIAGEEQEEKEQKQRKKKFERLVENVEKDVDKNREYQSHYEKARSLQEESKYTEAERIFEKAKKTKRKYEGALHRLEEIKNKGLEEQDLSYIGKDQKIENKKYPCPNLEFEGFTILWGRNAKENDILSLKFSKPWDIWFHTRVGTSSHVILKLKNKSEQAPHHVLLKAAEICKNNSDHKHSTKVEVMYTECKNLRKPKGLPPGKILYSGEKIVLV